MVSWHFGSVAPGRHDSVLTSIKCAMACKQKQKQDHQTLAESIVNGDVYITMRTDEHKPEMDLSEEQRRRHCAQD